MNSDIAEFRFGRFALDPVRRLLRVDGTPARLGARAIDVLLVLIRHRDRIVSKDQLLDLVWPGLVVEENNLQVQVSALRKLLGAHTIATIPGRGYQFIAELDAATPEAAGASATGATSADGDAGFPDPRRHLPARLPPLIGREADLAEARALLAAHPLVTLTGPGGIGKTRLAQAVALAVEPDCADGVRWIDLAAVMEPARVPAVVALAMGIELTSGQAPAALIASALRGQSLLVVLDNCEHVLPEVAGLVEQILRHAVGVRVLATSQAPLHLAGEQVVRLGPLALPSPSGAPDLATAERYGALRLFVERARAAQRGFALKPDTYATVAEICRRLDGMPLAIELAAARLPLLGLTGLRDRLDERLLLLTRGLRDAPARQQTLRATLEWSHSLLDAEEQRVFRQLGIFVGGFSLALAQRAVVDAASDPWSPLDHLGALVDKSLVVATGEGVPRYHLLESARVYALERLAAAGEVEVIEHRRAEAMRDLLDEFDAATAREPGFDQLVRALEPELDNLRAALRWTMASPAERPLALALLAASNSLWIETEPLGDAIDLYLTARAWLDDSIPPALAARFRLAFQSLARMRMLRPAQWSADAWAALAAYRTLGDRIGLYKSLCALGGASREVIDEAAAGALLDEAARLEDPAWSPRLRSRRQIALEWWHDLGGRFEAAREAGRQHLALARAAGAVGEISALGNLADTEFALGHAEDAIALCRQAIARAAAIGRPAAAAHAYGNMVPALIERGELAEAESTIRAGRALLVRGLGTAFILLIPLALLALRRDQHELAGRLLGCADASYATGGHFLHPPEQRMRTVILVALGGRYSEDAVADLLQQGGRWSESEGFAQAGMT